MDSASRSDRIRRPVRTPQRRLAGIPEGFLSPLLVPGEGLKVGKLAYQPDVAALADHHELRPALQLEVLAQLLGNRESAAIVQFGRPVLGRVPGFVARAHRSVALNGLHHHKPW